jgi:acetyl-CoA carboxylase biotin carboxylase subunit
VVHRNRITRSSDAKLIEEVHPGLPPMLRIRLNDAALRFARRLKYHGTGTVEFLDTKGRVLFLEMNARIGQHPVTEMVEGVTWLPRRCGRGRALS